MGIFDKVGSFIKREADDLGDAAEGIKEKFDQGLTKRENELEMTPSEKIAALQQEAAASDARFDAIADKAVGREAMADAVAKVSGVPSNDGLPNVTHIVLPDGRVKSGENNIAQVVDASGAMRDVPLVQAPTAEDLKKFEDPAPVAAEPADLAEAMPPAATPPPAGASAPPEPFEFPEPEIPVLPMDLSAPQGATTTSSAPAPGVTAPDIDVTVPDLTPDIDASVQDLTIPEITPDIDATIPDATAPSIDATIPDATAPSIDTIIPEITPDIDTTIIPEITPDIDTTIAETHSDAPSIDATIADVTAPSIDATIPETHSDAPSGAAADATETAPAAAAPAATPTSPDYGKTPAQIKYEQARAAANELLDELRGELKADGEI